MRRTNAENTLIDLISTAHHQHKEYDKLWNTFDDLGMLTEEDFDLILKDSNGNDFTIRLPIDPAVHILHSIVMYIIEKKHVKSHFYVDDIPQSLFDYYIDLMDHPIWDLEPSNKTYKNNYKFAVNIDSYINESVYGCLGMIAEEQDNFYFVCDDDLSDELEKTYKEEIPNRCNAYLDGRIEYIKLQYKIFE